jgi:hypothetical protein
MRRERKFLAAVTRAEAAVLCPNGLKNQPPGTGAEWLLAHQVSFSRCGPSFLFLPI